MPFVKENGGTQYVLGRFIAGITIVEMLFSVDSRTGLYSLGEEDEKTCQRMRA